MSDVELEPDDQFERFLREAEEWEAAEQAAKEAAKEAERAAYTNPDGSIIGLEDAQDLPRDIPLSQVNERMEAMRNDSILEVYKQMIGGRVRRESGAEWKVQCPFPDHPDTHPSANINTDLNVWFCYRCWLGGSVFDLMGAYWGYPFNSRALDPSWLRDVKKRYALEVHHYDYESEKHKALVIGETKTSQVTVAPTAEPAPQEPPPLGSCVPSYKIHDVLPDGGTFLRAYYDATVTDETPDEFQLWCGLVALAAAIGRKVTLTDFQPVSANLGVVLVGGTATGKSRSMRHVEAVLDMDSRLRWHGGNELGVKFRENPGSGQYLIKEFVDEEAADGKPVRHPVKMLVIQDEISALVNKGNSRESNHGVRQIVLQILDGKRRLHTGSMSSGNLEALDGFGLLLGATQPEIVPALFSDEDMVTGFMNRLIFVPGAPVKRSHRGAKPIQLDEAHRHLDRIVTWASHGIEIDEWDDDADALWKEAFEIKVDPLQRHPRWHKILGRLDLNMKRLILLFAANERSSTIQLQHVRSAVALLDYLIECYGNLMQHLETTEVSRAWVSIMKACAKLQESPKHDGHAPISMVRATVGLRGWDINAYRRELELMSENSLVEIYEHKKHNGRTVLCYRLTDDGVAALSSP